MNDTLEQFRLALAAAGLYPPRPLRTDGKFQRFSTNGKPRDQSGWYVLHIDGIAAGAFGDWRQGFTQQWCSKDASSMSEVERHAHLQRVQAMQRQRDDALAKCRQAAAAQAVQRWVAATPCTKHDYLTRKGIGPHGARIEGDQLLIPVRDTERTMHSLQSITPDGTKRFLTGGRVKGCYFSIGRPKGVLIICEGFATGASLYECSGHAVAVAFHASNLEAVAVALRAKYPDLRFIIAADDDYKTPDNPGLTKATAAAQATGASLAVPLFTEMTR